MPERVTLVAASTTEHVLERFDSVAADLFPQYSRAILQGWIKSGELTLDGDQVKPSRKLNGGEVLAIDAEVASVELHAETMELAIVYEDTDLLVVNKAAGLVVHPGAGNTSGTLLNGLLAHDEELASLPSRVGASVGQRYNRADGRCQGASGILWPVRTIVRENSVAGV